MTDLYTALTIGLIGSFHCIGMCGPIAVALPIGNKSWAGKLTGVLLYNLGSAFTYFGAFSDVFSRENQYRSTAYRLCCQAYRKIQNTVW